MCRVLGASWFRVESFGLEVRVLVVRVGFWAVDRLRLGVRVLVRFWTLDRIQLGVRDSVRFWA